MAWLRLDTLSICFKRVRAENLRPFFLDALSLFWPAPGFEPKALSLCSRLQHHLAGVDRRAVADRDRKVAQLRGDGELGRRHAGHERAQRHGARQVGVLVAAQEHGGAPPLACGH